MSAAAPAPASVVILNGTALPAGDARISPLGDGFMFGLGAFTTLKVIDGAPVFFAEHFARMSRDAAALGLAPPDEAALRERLALCIAHNGGAAAVHAAKVVRFADSGAGEGGVGELILPRAMHYPPQLYARGAKLRTVSAASDGGRALAGHKTINYLAHLRARRAAVADGLDDALWIAADETVLESASSNVFLVRAGEILTPAADAALLPGVARQIMLWLRPEIRETQLTRAMLAGADEVFLTNSLIGVLPVSQLDQQDYDVTAGKNPVTRALMAEFAAAERSSIRR